jgi:hypothetical protein
MPTKRDYLSSILSERSRIEGSRGLETQPPDSSFFPPMLPAADGRVILVSQKIIDDVHRYADVIMSNDASLPDAYTKKDLRSVVRRAFGRSLSSIDLANCLKDNIDLLSDAVEIYVHDAIGSARIEQTFTFGSWLFSGNDKLALSVGPVRISDRLSWLSDAMSAGRISEVTSARLVRRWSGIRTRKRKASFDQAAEAAIVSAVGDCPAVTSIPISSLTGGAAEEKALRAARVAHIAVALLWETPSSVLDRMGLLFDGDMRKRHYVILATGGRHGSSSSVSRLSGGMLKPENWEEVWADSEWFIKPIGDAITLHLRLPNSSAQPRVLSALFLSLWWFQAACEERSPLFATVKLAASMDALAKGKGRAGITQLLDARRGVEQSTPLFVNGATAWDLLGDIYELVRNRTIHGTLPNVGHDWTETRSRAEMLARLCLRFTCAWIHDNPGNDDLDALRRR